jgi:hypothetical protein
MGLQIKWGDTPGGWTGEDLEGCAHGKQGVSATVICSAVET